MNALEAKFAGVGLTCLCPTRLQFLYYAINSTSTLRGEIWECGTYRGGSAMCMKGQLIEEGSARVLRLFDTFEGMPVSGEWDTHAVGTFSETSKGGIYALFEGLEGVLIHPGIMPATFAGLEETRISLAHIDVDQYESVHACLAFVYPRMEEGGYLVLDDYNCPGCPGAKRAVDEFFADKPEPMMVTHGTPQVWYVKGAVRAALPL